MTTFTIEGKVKGQQEISRNINRYPKIYFFQLRSWMEDERAIMLGSKPSDKKKRRGYRDILANKRLSNRPQKWQKWSKRVTNLFKGSLPYVDKIGDLELSMGLISRSNHQLIKAIKLLNKGGYSTSSKFMPVPIYKNLAKVGYEGPWHIGNVKSGLKSKAFRAFNRVHFAGEGKRLVRIKSGGRILYFDRKSFSKRKKAFKRSGLLFIGMKRIQIKRHLTGKYDFNQRWNRQKVKTIVRGQRSVDKATRMANRKARRF